MQQSTTTVQPALYYEANITSTPGKVATIKPAKGTNRVLLNRNGGTIKRLGIAFKNSTSPATARGFNISIRNSTAPPSNVTKLQSSGVYRYIQINQGLTNNGNSIDPYISNVTYNFSVPSSWVDGLKIGPRSVSMFKYSDNGWYPIPTTMTGSNATSFSYSADSSSLSTYAVAWVTGNAIKTSSPDTLTLGSGFNSYFYAAAIHMTNTNQFATVNFLVQNTVGLSSGGGGGKHTDNAIIGSNAVLNVGQLTASASAADLALAGLGANVIAPTNTLASMKSTATTQMGVDTNGNVFTLGATKVTTGTTETLSYNTLTPNSFVVLLAADNATFGTITLPSNCKQEDKISESTFASVYVANCIESGGAFTFKMNPASHEATVSMGAYVFPSYTVWMEDNPGNGNILTASCESCNPIDQINGNTISVIGDGDVNAVIPSGDTFNSWLVDPSNSANVVFSSSTSANTFLSIMGNAIITATFTVPPSCTTVLSNTLLNFGTVLPGTSTSATQNSANVKNTGTTTANICLEGTSWQYATNSFDSTNTVWTTNDLGSTGKLTGTFVDTTEQAITGSSNVVYFGVSAPFGMNEGNYIQTITIEDSC